MIYSILSLLCGCLAATAELSEKGCVGGACVTDEGALIQKAAQATVGVERDEDLFRTNEHRVEFHMSEREFDNATELIPQKLRAAGVDAETYDPDRLMVFTASGAMMKSEPSRADFPLKMVLIPSKLKPDFKDYQVTPMDMDMAMLADKVYTGATEGIKCWAHWGSAVASDTSFFFAKNRDRYSLHTCVCDYCKIPDSELKTCALSFSGSNDAQDWLNNFDTRGSASFCGGAQRHHGGFQKEANFLMDDLAGREAWINYMQGCGRIIFTGHSLGGAIATLFAGCVNCRSPECTDTRPALLASFAKRGIAAELYTIGAPATTYGKEFKSEVSQDGVFPGVRFWTYTRKCFIVWGCQDPVPFGSLQLSFHPRMKAVGLGGRGGTMGWEGTTDEAIFEPSSYMLFKASEHSAERYLNRMLMHAAKGKVDVPGPPPATEPIPPGPSVPPVAPPVGVEKGKEADETEPTAEKEEPNEETNPVGEGEQVEAGQQVNQGKSKSNDDPKKAVDEARTEADETDPIEEEPIEEEPNETDPNEEEAKKAKEKTAEKEEPNKEINPVSEDLTDESQEVEQQGTVQQDQNQVAGGGDVGKSKDNDVDVDPEEDKIDEDEARQEGEDREEVDD